MRSLALFLLLAFSPPSLAQSVTLPAEVRGEPGEFIVVNAETDDTLVKWHVIDKGINLFPQQLQKDTKVAVVVSLKPGRYRLLAVSAKDGTPSDFAQCTIVVGDAPGPTPPPPDPEPDPTPGPSPIPAPGFRVLMTFEDEGGLTRSQLDALNSPELISYLKSKCAKESNGVPSYRKWDDDLEVDKYILADYWKAAFHNIMAKAKEDESWIAVSDGTRGEIVPLPQTLPELMAVLKRYGGQ